MINSMRVAHRAIVCGIVAPCQPRLKRPLAHVAGTCTQWQGKCCQQAGSDASARPGITTDQRPLPLPQIQGKCESLEEGIIARDASTTGPAAHDAARIRRVAWFSLYRSRRRCGGITVSTRSCVRQYTTFQLCGSKAHFNSNLCCTDATE